MRLPARQSSCSSGLGAGTGGQLQFASHELELELPPVPGSQGYAGAGFAGKHGHAGQGYSGQRGRGPGPADVPQLFVPVAQPAQPPGSARMKQGNTADSAKGNPLSPTLAALARAPPSASSLARVEARTAPLEAPHPQAALYQVVSPPPPLLPPQPPPQPQAHRDPEPISPRTVARKQLRFFGEGGGSGGGGSSGGGGDDTTWARDAAALGVIMGAEMEL